MDVLELSLVLDVGGFWVMARQSINVSCLQTLEYSP